MKGVNVGCSIFITLRRDTLRQYFPAYMIPVSSGMKSKLLYSVRSGGGGGGLESDLCKEYEKAWNKVSKECFWD